MHTIISRAIDTLSKSRYFGIISSKNIVELKDTILRVNSQNRNCKYSRNIFTTKYKGSNNILELETVVTESNDSTSYFNEFDDSLVEIKLEYTYDLLQIDNLLYRIKLINNFDDISIYLLNLKLLLLQSFIKSAKCNIIANSSC
jgi:hypothetical protein